MQDLRYGENPHQAGAFYRAPREPEEPTVAFAQVLQGKELSYNNLLDLEAALAAVKEYEGTACVVIKHNTPSGVALAATPAEAFALARDCDPVSAFGGIVALNRPVDAAAAKELAGLFLECVIAPAYAPGGPRRCSPRRRTSGCSRARASPTRAPRWKRRPEEARELRSITGGLLVMDRDLGSVRREDCKVMTKRAPTEKEWQDLLFAWKVVKHVKSNAIVFAAGDRTLAIGGGQTSRVESVKIARMKARFPLAGSAVGSDAFFPFPDGVEEIIAGRAPPPSSSRAARSATPRWWRWPTRPGSPWWPRGCATSGTSGIPPSNANPRRRRGRTGARPRLEDRPEPPRGEGVLRARATPGPRAWPRTSPSRPTTWTALVALGGREPHRLRGGRPGGAARAGARRPALRGRDRRSSAPTAAAAQLEGSKAFAKEVMAAAGIPTADLRRLRRARARRWPTRAPPAAGWW